MLLLKSSQHKLILPEITAESVAKLRGTNRKLHIAEGTDLSRERLEIFEWRLNSAQSKILWKIAKQQSPGCNLIMRSRSGNQRESLSAEVQKVSHRLKREIGQKTTKRVSMQNAQLRHDGKSSIIQYGST